MVLVHLVPRFFMGKFKNKVLKKIWKLQGKKRRRKIVFFLYLYFRFFLSKYMHCFSEVHRNCSWKTFWSTFLVLLLLRACCWYVPPHFTITQFFLHIFGLGFFFIFPLDHVNLSSFSFSKFFFFFLLENINLEVPNGLKGA